ncbi:MAG: cardiolipin hydrolase [Arenicella sp.]|jgi:cardiolipin hydrolase
MNDIIALLKESLDDNFLVKAEKRGIKTKILDFGVDKRKGDLLRSEIFKMAQAKITSENYTEVLAWVEEVNKVILGGKGDEGANERVYFSPGEECLGGILSQIKGSSQVIKICLFTISDDRISEALISKHKQGVNIKIITDNDKINDKGSDIRKLVQAGISVKVDVTDNHMHHKFAIFDKKTTLTGSYNWTRSAEKYNHENILITDSKKVQSSFDKEFIDLWNELIFYDEI